MASECLAKNLLDKRGKILGAKHFWKKNYKLWVALGENRRGKFLVITEQKEDANRRIFFPEGPQAKDGGDIARDNGKEV